MDTWEFDDLIDWDEFEDDEDLMLQTAFALAELIFLSEPDLVFDELDDYVLGYVDAFEWLTLVELLDEIVSLETLLDDLEDLSTLLPFPGVPSALLEDPLLFLSSCLAGNLPKEASGRRVGSRKLVKISQSVIQLVQSFPDTAQATVRTWAAMQRDIHSPFASDLFDEEDMADLLLDSDLPPAMKGFSTLVALTFMHCPERAEGLPLPPEFSELDLYEEMLAGWEMLPASRTTSETETGEAEALFAQGQLAHLLAKTGAAEMFTAGALSEEDEKRAYSRLSRAILWIHNQCRTCSERDGIACQVASNWSERPVPLLDVAGEIASTNRVAGCIKM